jgi:hypothetical protein
MSLVVASKRTFGTAITNEQRRNQQQKRSEGHARDPSFLFENEENISNLHSSAEFEFKINSTTIGSVRDLKEVVDIYIRNGDTRNLHLR